MDTARLVTANLLNLVVAVCFLGMFIAIVLRMAAKWVENIDVSFDNAFRTVLLGVLANVILAPVQWLIYIVTAVTTQSEAGVYAAGALMCPLIFLIQARILGWRLRIPLHRACLVGLAMVGIGLALAAIFCLFVFVGLQFVR